MSTLNLCYWHLVFHLWMCYSFFFTLCKLFYVLWFHLYCLSFYHTSIKCLNLFTHDAAFMLLLKALLLLLKEQLCCSSEIILLVFHFLCCYWCFSCNALALSYAVLCWFYSRVLLYNWPPGLQRKTSLWLILTCSRCTVNITHHPAK